MPQMMEFEIIFSELVVNESKEAFLLIFRQYIVEKEQQLYALF